MDSNLEHWHEDGSTKQVQGVGEVSESLNREEQHHGYNDWQSGTTH